MPAIESRQGLKIAVALEEKSRAVPIVGARLGNDVDDTGSRPAYFGRIAVSGDLELSHRILWEIGKCATDDFVIIIAAIHGDVSTPPELARRGHL